VRTPLGPGQARVVIVDGRMRSTDGRPVVAILAGAPALADSAFVVLTRVGDPAVAPEDPSASFTRLAKPVFPSATRAALEAVLGLKPQPAPASRPAGPARTQPLTILVAEDNRVNRRVIESLLTRRGHRVVLADNGRLAVDAWRAERFDVILMDVQMPEMDGFEATEAIREREDWSVQRTPIIALTAHAMSGDRERCLGHGMDAYVQKPIDSAEMLSTIARLFVPPGSA
jgi:CheY-like chemotaxis protein